MIHVALVGFGGIAQSAHLPAYQALEKRGKARLVAACDVDAKRFAAKPEINIRAGEAGQLDMHFYTDLDEMLAAETVDMLDVCLPTYLHAPTAIRLLKDGYHVLCEKPMALHDADCQAMIEAAVASRKKLMIGQCLRFSAPYLYIKELAASGEYGRPLSATFRRFSGPPIWGWENWFMDKSKSGGCLLDMHIHDVDAARFLFGEPKEVSCVTQDVYSGLDIVHSRLYYEDFSVLAIGDWSQESVEFTADYRVAFEKATVLYENGTVKTCPRGGAPFTPTLEDTDMYQGEIEALVDAITAQGDERLVSPESAAASVRMAGILRESAKQGGKRLPFGKEKKV